jgi:hypothetical protein
LHFLRTHSKGSGLPPSLCLSCLLQVRDEFACNTVKVLFKFARPMQSMKSNMLVLMGRAFAVIVVE